MSTTTSSESLSPLGEQSIHAAANLRFRQRLVAARKEVANRFEQERSTLGTIDDEPMDEVDRASQATADSYSGDLGDMHRSRIRQIDEALERLARGEYGLCLECGEPISPRRLQVLPESQFCVDCKDLQEHFGESSGGPWALSERWDT